MFTIKFYATIGEDTSALIISCPMYQTFERKDGSATITVFKSHLCANGIDYTVGFKNIGHYDHCYIENEAGKTIAHYSVNQNEEN